MSSKSSGGDDDSTGLRAAPKLNTPLLRCAVGRRTAMIKLLPARLSKKLATGEPPGSPVAVFARNPFECRGFQEISAVKRTPCGGDDDGAGPAGAHAGRAKTQGSWDSARAASPMEPARPPRSSLKLQPAPLRMSRPALKPANAFSQFPPERIPCTAIQAQKRAPVSPVFARVGGRLTNPGSLAWEDPGRGSPGMKSPGMQAASL